MLVDSVGNEYRVGAIVRMKHFDTNRKKYYMYKQVFSIDNEKGRVGFSHLPASEKEFRLHFYLGDTELRRDTVIVECYYEDYRELKRNRAMRD